MLPENRQAVTVQQRRPDGLGAAEIIPQRMRLDGLHSPSPSPEQGDTVFYWPWMRQGTERPAIHSGVFFEVHGPLVISPDDELLIILPHPQRGGPTEVLNGGTVTKKLAGALANYEGITFGLQVRYDHEISTGELDPRIAAQHAVQVVPEAVMYRIDRKRRPVAAGSVDTEGRLAKDRTDTSEYLLRLNRAHTDRDPEQIAEDYAEARRLFADLDAQPDLPDHIRRMLRESVNGENYKAGQEPFTSEINYADVLAIDSVYYRGVDPFNTRLASRTKEEAKEFFNRVAIEMEPRPDDQEADVPPILAMARLIQEKFDDKDAYDFLSTTIDAAAGRLSKIPDSHDSWIDVQMINQAMRGLALLPLQEAPKKIFTLLEHRMHYSGTDRIPVEFDDQLVATMISSLHASIRDHGRITINVLTKTQQEEATDRGHTQELLESWLTRQFPNPETVDQLRDLVLWTNLGNGVKEFETMRSETELDAALEKQARELPPKVIEVNLFPGVEE